MPSALRPVRLVSIGAFCAWLLFSALAYRQVPYFEHAWAGNLLQYLPEWAAWLLTLVALLATTEEARGWVIRAAKAVADAGAALPVPLRDAVLFAAAAAALWLVRERAVFGQSDQLLAILLHDGTRLAGGGAEVMRTVVRAARALGVPPMEAAQLVCCGFGAAAVVLVTRAARTLERPGATALVPLVVFSAGLLRAIGGRLDRQAVFVAAAALCLAFALACLRGRTGLAPTALAFGVAAAVDPLGRFLLPGLAVVAWARDPASPRAARVRAIAVALGVAAAVVGLQAVVLLATGGADADRAVAAVAGRPPDGWVRGFGNEQRANTFYVLFSHAHAKYLGNALWLLAPAALPLVVGVAAARRGRVLTDRDTRFLAATCASLVVGSCLIRPIGGPFDWSLLAVPALFLAFFAAVLAAEIESAALRAHVVTALVALQLAFVGVPLSAISLGTTYEAGPFAADAYPTWRPTLPRRAPAAVVDWL